MKQNYALKAAALGLVAVTAFGASAVSPQTAARSFAPKKVAQLNTIKTRTVNTVSAKNGVEEYSILNAKRITRPALDLDLTQQAVSRAINPYGAWEDAGTLTYTYNNLFEGDGIEKTYTYQKRVNSRNPENFQIKVANWGAFTAQEVGEAMPGVELVLTVTPVADAATGATTYEVTTSNPETLANEGIALGWKIGVPETPGSENSIPVEAYYYDHYTWISKVASVTPGIDPAVAPSWKGSSVYDPQTGKFTIMPIYSCNEDAYIKYALAYSNGQNKYWYDYIQLSGEYFNYDFDIDTQAGYFYRNAGETAGHYKAYYQLNDNAIGLVKLLPGKLEAAALNAEFNAMVDQINDPTPDMAVFTDKEGWFDVEVSNYTDGYYTLIFGVGSAPDEQGIAIEGGFLNVINDGAEFVLDGYAKYNDVIIPAFLSLIQFKDGSSVTPESLGLPSSYTTTCQVEKSEQTPGVYRLRAPYAEYPYEDVFDYSQPLDYLYYNIADPTKAEVDFCFTGLTINIGEDVLIAYGSTHVVLEGEAEQTIYGSFADNKLTFPSTTFEQDFQFQGSNGQPIIEHKTMSGLLAVMAAFGQNAQGQATVYSYDWASPANTDEFLVETGATDAIKGVEADAAADANAPVEYFNLQGQKVMAPAAGQLVIKKQGGKVSKMIVR